MRFMNKVRPKLYEKDENRILKNGTFWNLCASLFNSMMTAFILFFVMRLNGVEDAGLFSIASALAYQALTVGLFGVRNYHAADVFYDYDFSDYFYLRIITSVLMYCVVVYYAFCQGYSIDKAAVVFTFSLFKSIDALEDLYHGEYQRQGRLDIAAYLQTVRYAVSLVVLIGLLVFFHSLSICFLITSIVSLVIFVFQNLTLIRTFTTGHGKYILRKEKVKDLFIATLPLCLATWLNIYILNAAKYSIDQVQTSEMQAYFGTLVLPVFTINLLATVIYRPYISVLASDWKSGKKQAFLKGCARQFLIIMALTAFITAFGWLLGLRLLAMLYDMDLMPYMTSFLLLLAGGGLNTLAVFFTVVLTIQEKQNVIFAGYVLSFLFCMLFSDQMVGSGGLTGASWVYILASAILCIFYAIVFVKTVKNKKSEKTLSHF